MTLLDLPNVTFEESTALTFAADTSPIHAPGIHTQAIHTQVEVTELETELDDAELDESVPTLSSYARCADGNGTLTHLFFSDDEFDIARAKAICGKCGQATACLAGALDRAESYGVWGGQLLIDGAIVAVKRGRGRPPKSPRPPLVVDEVPLPPHLVA